MFGKLLTLEYNHYYTIRKDRPDYDDFIVMLKKRIDMYQDFMFTRDYSQFTRIITVEEMERDFDVEFENGIKIKYHFFQGEKRQEIMDKVEYNLPDPQFKSYNKKQFDQALGRK